MDHIVIWLKHFVLPWLPIVADWVSALPDWMKDSKIIEIVLLLLIANYLRRQRTGLDHTVDRLEDHLLTFRKMLEALRDETETISGPGAPSPDGGPLAPSPNGGPEAPSPNSRLKEPSPNGGSEMPSPDISDAGPEYWERVRKLWAAARNRIELAIEGVSDGRKRRRYANMDRRIYRDIIFALTVDKVLSNAAAASLIQMNGIFLRLRASPRSTTRQDAERFDSLYKVVSSSLPEEPRPASPSAGEERLPQAELLPELTLDVPGVPERSGSQHSSQRMNGPSGGLTAHRSHGLTHS